MSTKTKKKTKRKPRKKKIESLRESTKKQVFTRISPQVFMLTIAIVVFYYGYILLAGKSLEVGLLDWGLDLGYTQLFWGVLLIILSVLLAIYPLQSFFKSKSLDDLYLILVSFPLGVALYFLVFWAWIAHFPQLNFYGTATFNWGDKFFHFLTALTITLILIRVFLKFGNSPFTAIFVAFSITMFYEIFEVVVIFNFATVWNEFTNVPILFDDIQAQLWHELADVIPDTLFNILGIFFGYVFSRNLISKRKKKRK
jgi:VanZ family protein